MSNSAPGDALLASSPPSQATIVPPTATADVPTPDAAPVALTRTDVYDLYVMDHSIRQAAGNVGIFPPQVYGLFERIAVLGVEACRPGEIQAALDAARWALPPSGPPTATPGAAEDFDALTASEARAAGAAAAAVSAT